MTTDEQRRLLGLLNRDPMAEVERVTRESYEEDSATAALGILAHMEHSEAKRQALAAIGDTHYGMSLDDFLEVAKAQGFCTVHEHEFTSKDGASETYRIMFPGDPVREAVLLTVESFTWSSEDKVPTANYARVYFEHEHDAGVWASLGSSMPVKIPEGRGVVRRTGEVDVREAMVTKLAEVREQGTIVPVWQRDWADPLMWVPTLMDRTEGEDYDPKTWRERSVRERAKTLGRARTLPPYVQHALGLPKEES